MHVYKVRPPKDKRGADLISDALPFGGLWYAGPNAVSNAIGYAVHYSRSADAVIRVCDPDGNVIETHEQERGRLQRVLIATYVHEARSIIKVGAGVIKTSDASAAQYNINRRR